MNYRHIYHAGNFADVFKHAVLARILSYLKRKDKAFRVIDTHAGTGVYDLGSAEAQKTGEWRHGIGRLLAASLETETRHLLAPYLDQIRALNPNDEIVRYPGSPMIARMLIRKQDRLSAIELHPEDASKLRSHFDGDYQVRVIRLDGWLALGSHVPPKERRGLVLVDPPFEATDEFDRLTDGLARALRRWHDGVYCLWYPLKRGAQASTFHRRLGVLGLDEAFAAELWVRDRESESGLAGSGLAIVNPPFTLKSELETILPVLRDVLAQDETAGFRIVDL